MPRNKCRTVFTFSVLPLATVAVLGVSSINMSIYAQNPSSTNNPNNSPAINPQNQIQPQTEQQNKLEDTLETLSEDYKSIGDYQDKLLNTVLLTLMGTVVSISLTFFGFQVFTNITSRSREDQIIESKIKDLLQESERNLATKTERQLNSIEVKMKWIEYALATFSIEQMTMLDIDKESETLHYVIKEHRIAIEKLKKLQNDNQGSFVGDCIITQLEAIDIFCQDFSLVKFNGNSKLLAEIKELENTLQPLNNGYEVYTKRIKDKIKELV